MRPFAGITEKDIENEARVIRELQNLEGHPNIISILRDGWEEVPFLYYFLDMELCDLNLKEYIRGDQRETQDIAAYFQHSPTYVSKDCSALEKLRNIWTIMRHIVQGLLFLHQNKQVRRDLKPSNSNLHALQLLICSSLLSRDALLENRRFWCYCSC